MFYVLSKDEFPQIKEYIRYFRNTAKTPVELEDMVNSLIQEKKLVAVKAHSITELDTSMEYGTLSIRKEFPRRINGLVVQSAGDVILSVWQYDGETLSREKRDDSIEVLQNLNGMMLFELPPVQSDEKTTYVDLSIHLDGDIKLRIPKEKVSALLGTYSGKAKFMADIIQNTPFTYNGSAYIDNAETDRLEKTNGIHGHPFYTEVSGVQKK